MMSPFDALNLGSLCCGYRKSSPPSRHTDRHAYLRLSPSCWNCFQFKTKLFMMEKNRIVLFNILKYQTKCILQSLQDSNNSLISRIRGLLHGIPGISDEELERIETVDHLWETLVQKEVISMDDLQVLKTLAEFLKSRELKKEIGDYEYECSGAVRRLGLGISRTTKLVIKTVLPLTVGLAVLNHCGENEVAKQVVLEKLVLPSLVNLDEVREGSVCFVIETSSLSSLQKLWTSYKDGSLEKKFKKVINEIDDVRKLTQGTEIDVTVEIDEDEYREACWVLVLARSHEFQDVTEKESGKSVQRLCQRRHSLSCRRDLLPPRDNTQFSWQEWRALMEVESKLENEIRQRMCVEKQNEELRKEIEVLKVIKDTAEEEKKGIMTLRMDVEKQIEELKKEVLKGVEDTAKTKREDIMALREINEELMTELETSKTTEPKTVDKLKKTIEYGEAMLKIAVEENDPVGMGSAYTKIGVLYSALGTVYNQANEKEDCEDTMKKAESYFREAADCWEKLNAQLNNDDEKSVVEHSLFITYQYLTAVLLASKQTEEALIVSDNTRDRDLVRTMIEKFQMNQDILSESMRHANISSILENKNVSVLVYAVRDDKINIWTLEYQQPSVFVEKKVPLELEQRTSVDSYITNLVDAAWYASSYLEPLEQLYELLIAPVLPHLTQDKLVIIADGPLHLVPFAALRDPKTGQFLSEIKCIRYAPSLSAMKVWKECPVDHHANTGALIVGDPDIGTVRFEGKMLEYQQLHYAQQEAQILGKMLDARPFIGPQATKDEVLKRLQEPLAVIHIAALGNDKGEIILGSSSGTRDSIPEEEDYLLTIQEVQEMHIQAQLVVLSLSTSGCGEITGGKVISMARAFLAAGARAVVASLWAIKDYATLRFMTSFYASLKMGESASESLQIAMKDIRDEEDYENPRFWAPFFLIGDDVAISSYRRKGN